MVLSIRAPKLPNRPETAPWCHPSDTPENLAFIRRRLELRGFESVDDMPVGLEHLIVGNIIHGVLLLVTHNHPSTLFPGLGDDGLTRYKSKHGPDQYNRRRRLGHCIGHGG